MLEKVKWLGHASLLIDGEKKIYVDPYEIPAGLPQASIIFCTHDHFDHLSEKDIKKILKDETVLVVPESVEGTGPGCEVRRMKAGDEIFLGEIKVRAVPAYNVGKDFHPQDNRWLGFVITSEGTTYYHAGDTDVIPEMSDVETDVAFLPVGGTYTMTPEEAFTAAESIQAKLFVPFHYGSIIGDENDANKFKELCEAKGLKAEVMEKFNG